MVITAAWEGLGAPVYFLAVQRVWIGDGVCKEYRWGQTNEAIEPDRGPEMGVIGG